MISTNYELVYEKDGKFFGSNERIPHDTGDIDLGITREQVEGYKLVYVANNKILGSATGIPDIDNDTLIYATTTEEEVPEVTEEPAEIGDETVEEPAAKEETTNENTEDEVE